MENLNVKIASLEGNVLTILQGETIPLQPKAPEKIIYTGIIESPGNFLEKKK